MRCVHYVVFDILKGQGKTIQVEVIGTTTNDNKVIIGEVCN
jgi:hypothetical protein